MKTAAWNGKHGSSFGEICGLMFDLKSPESRTEIRYAPRVSFLPFCASLFVVFCGVFAFVSFVVVCWFLFSFFFSFLGGGGWGMRGSMGAPYSPPPKKKEEKKKRNQQTTKETKAKTPQKTTNKQTNKEAQKGRRETTATTTTKHSINSFRSIPRTVRLNFFFFFFFFNGCSFQIRPWVLRFRALQSVSVTSSVRPAFVAKL